MNESILLLVYGCHFGFPIPPLPPLSFSFSFFFVGLVFSLCFSLGFAFFVRLRSAGTDRGMAASFLPTERLLMIVFFCFFFVFFCRHRLVSKMDQTRTGERENDEPEKPQNYFFY